MIQQSQKLKQQLKLTPQQIMLMKLLQLPIASLEQTIKEELEKNPLLEILDPPMHQEESLNSISDSSDLDDDDDYRYLERQERDKNIQYHDPVFIADTSSAERLIEQLEFKNLSARQMSIGREIIGSIDDSGYLCRDLGLITNDMAFRQGVDVSIDEAQKVLDIIQSLEPAGIGARSLQECLSLQLHRLPNNDNATQAATLIVDRYFDLFTKHNYDRILQHSGMSHSTLESAIDLIRRLNPKPGPGVTESVQPTHYVIPDFTVSCHDSHITLTHNDKYLPRLRLNSYYQEMLSLMLLRDSS